MPSSGETGNGVVPTPRTYESYNALDLVELVEEGGPALAL